MLNAYDPQNDKVLHVGPTGQKSFQIDQLILLGGKRKSQIELARTDVAIAELEFQNLARQLKFKLHQAGRDRSAAGVAPEIQCTAYPSRYDHDFQREASREGECSIKRPGAVERRLSES